ncbi:CDP-diacylglycerol--glycerol-3-phosphate 3-phosphatidyltransferase [bacterium]|nr:MAG: CDP-diacylglycerol--glycerol-3-phosphate 3-phosphatidyltransferase [bacterium]QQR62432.1 MAG: CDP-diacylglycerol--glycerol-3-phosphate 3-phosphatidyltransferase [bacterium]
MNRQYMLTLPNVLTLLRLILSPIFIPFLLVYLLPLNFFFLNVLLALIFILFGLTDFFDGYFARKWNQVTHLGALLDPIADKFLFCSTLISLLAAGKLFFYWVIILLSREFFVMGIRLIASERGYYIKTLFIAKIKTVVEVFFIASVIINPSTVTSSFFNKWNIIEYLLLNSTLLLSLYSAYLYYVLCAAQFHVKIGFNDQ